MAIEAKGRTNGWTDALRTSAKARLRRSVSLFNPVVLASPSKRTSPSLAFFDGEGWSLLMDDPPAKPQPLRLAVPADELYRAYYDPVLAYVGAALERDSAQSVLVDSTGFKVVYDPDLDLFVGVANAVIESGGADIETIRAALAQVLEARETGRRLVVPQVEDDEGRAWSVGADGVIVRLGERWQ